MSEITIRLAEKGDVPAMVELWKEFVGFHVALDPHLKMVEDGAQIFAEHIESLLEDEKAYLLLALAGKTAVGYCKAQVSQNPPVFARHEYGFLSDLAVTAEYRRQGVGEALFEKAKKWFKKQGMDRIELRVAPSNPLSTSFWEKMGFVPFVNILGMDI